MLANAFPNQEVPSNMLLDVATDTNAHAKCAFRASRAPSPSLASPQRQVIPPKGKKRAGDADQGSADDIETVVVEVEESRGADVECHSDRHESDSDQMVWRRRCKLAHRDLARI